MNTPFVHIRKTDMDALWNQRFCPARCRATTPAASNGGTTTTNSPSMSTGAFPTKSCTVIYTTNVTQSIPNITGKFFVSAGNRGAVSLPNGLYTSVGTLPVSSGLAPQAVYNGGYTSARDIGVRIANGGAGQSGLIGAWANAFIQYSVSQGHQPFLVRAQRSHYCNLFFCSDNGRVSRLRGIWAIRRRAWGSWRPDPWILQSRTTRRPSCRR